MNWLIEKLLEKVEQREGVRIRLMYNNQRQRFAAMTQEERRVSGRRCGTASQTTGRGHR